MNLQSLSLFQIDGKWLLKPYVEFRRYITVNIMFYEKNV